MRLRILSPYSNVSSATAQTPDTQPPTAPSSLTATAASSSQINLSWTASTDNVGVTGYFIERCQGVGCTLFFRIAVSAGTTYNDTGLTERNQLQLSSAGHRRGREPEHILECSHCYRTTRTRSRRRRRRI